MYKEIINNIKPDLDRTVEYLSCELNKLRIGRATPAMVEDIMVDCYNQKLPIKQLGSISVPQPRVINISPWDKSILSDIEKAIRNQSGLGPVVNADMVKINIPPLSEDQRKEYVKIIAEKAEEARISIRLHRERVWKEIQELEKKGEIREDDKFRGKDELQKLIDEYNEKVEEMRKKKEEEVMTV